MTFPVDIFSSVTIEAYVDTRTPKKTRYVRDRARGNKAPFFMLSLTSDALPYAEYMKAQAVLESYEGALEVFGVPNPLPALASFNNLSVSSTATAKSKTVVLQGIHALQVGDFIQFDNHAKAYRISSVSTVSSQTTVGLGCPLFMTVTTSTGVLYGNNVIFQVCLDSYEPMTIDASNGKFGTVDVELVEQA